MPASDDLTALREEIAELRAEVGRLQAAQWQSYAPLPYANACAGPPVLPLLVNLGADAGVHYWPTAVAAGCAGVPQVFPVPVPA